MPKNEPFICKENWQIFMMNPGPSSHSDLGLPTTQKFRQTANGRAMKQTWTCGVCRKELSSKRSFTEHMNIHNKSRPFQCEHCTYAAASQMTLHRHKLRNHTPKTEWGYRCPYCEDAYMEPAGYQQHVQQRHHGRSATYGCPFRVCKFTSKSQRHFREHLVKHDRSDKLEGSVDPCTLTNQQLVRYMVSDEIGHGFQRPGGSSGPVRTVRVRPQVVIAPNHQSSTEMSVSGVVSSTGEPVRYIVEKVIPNKTMIRNNQIPSKPLQHYYEPSDSYLPTGGSYSHHHNHNQFEQQHYEEMIDEEEEDEGDIDESEEEIEEYDEGPPILESFESSTHHHQLVIEHGMDNNWTESEVEIPTKGRVLPNGLIDEELD